MNLPKIIHLIHCGDLFLDLQHNNFIRACASRVQWAKNLTKNYTYSSNFGLGILA